MQAPVWRVSMGMRGAVLASALLFSSNGSWAQNALTISGVIDASVDLVKTGDPGMGWTRKISSGGGNASRLVFSGREDLSSDVSAMFMLDSAFFADTGATFNPAIPPTGIFGRRAVIGLNSRRWGGITVGRDYTPAFLMLVKADLAGMSYYGALTSITHIANPRANNGLFYTSPGWAGVTLRTYYSTGLENTSAPLDEGRQHGWSLEYADDVLFIGATNQISDTRVSTTDTRAQRESGAGAKYRLGVVSINTGFFVVDPPGPDNAIRAYWLGLGRPVGDRIRVGVQLSRTIGDASTDAKARAHTVALHSAYDFSKRSEMYVTYGRTANNVNAKFALGGSIGPVNVTPLQFGSSPVALTIGLSQAF